MTEDEKKYRDHLNEMVEKRTAELKEEIAERKNAEKKLLESEKKFRDLFENMMDGLVLHRLIVDENGNPVDYILEKMNAAAEKILSWKRENIEGKRATEVYNGDTPFIERYAKVAQTGKSKYFIEYYPGFGKWYEIMSFCPEKGHFANMFRDITERKQIQKVLRESEDRYRTIFENTGTVMVIIEEDKTISLANAEFERLSGYSRKEIEGKKKLTEFIVAEDLEKIKDYHEQRRVDPTSAPKRYEFRFIDRKVNIRDILLSIDVIPGTKISVASLLDITERKKAEEKIKASLKEKDVMLREIHHRVKNNMQIVSSLLRLQSAKAEGKKTQEIFRKCQNRIRTMSIIHEKLYQSKDLAKINYAQYIDRLAVHIFQSYGVDSNLVALKTDLEEVFLDLNRAIPCGLIINELLSNSVKHAFPEGKKGEILVKLHSDKKGTITLVVSDNGIGFPDDIDFQKAQSLGLQMVNDLTRQIGGTIKLDRTGGTAFKVKFSVNK